RIEIVTDLPEETCFVDADPSQFDTALVNMAVNARDAMDGAGRLTISVRAADVMPSMRRLGAVEDAFVAVSVSDTGCGIPTERLEQIFEPFFTTKGVGQGTGLGLSQVFGFAKQSGGEVTVASKVGEGTTFTLYLPRVSGEGRATEAVPEPELLADGHGTCVLVVEDNVEVGTFATHTLAELGYETVWASNAQEALEELGKDASRFDLVFSDVVMP
ncbi:ATP-binding protein, partial [Methylobacterium aquaticum]